MSARRAFRQGAGVAALGLDPRLRAHARDRHGYLAGRDQDRAADLNQSLGIVTISDLAGVATALQHEEGVRAWAEGAWSAWAEHHAIVRGWVPA